MPARRITKRRGRGRPTVHTETWTKVSVVLLDRQIKRLDRQVTVLQKQAEGPINRASIIRALTDALFDADVDLSSCRTEQDIRVMLTRLLDPPTH
jgi:hypothetical protein